ncbi:MAG: HD domain-containing protein [Candidatus Obscuribacterales bacterium]|nr:HD domain-containing protein [Candidatus Obscuribacterales bacterium]
MLIEKAQALVLRCISDPQISALYDAGDRASSHQTKHDIDHALQVMKLAQKVADKLAVSHPGKFDDWTRTVVIPLAAFLHDIGRAFDVDDHAKAGAKWSKGYFAALTVSDTDNETLPVPVINRICRIIAMHRSSIVLKRDFNDSAWAVVVLADKCVGDEDRVRPNTATLLETLTTLRLLWLPLRISVHDRANFAIKRADVEVRDKEIVLAINLDKRVCKPDLIYNLYGERFYACAKAAKYFGVAFLMEFNGVVYRYDTGLSAWTPEAV